MTTYKNYDDLCSETKQMPPDTDLLALANLCKRFGIDYEIDKVINDDGSSGYGVILTDIIFDKNGKFEKLEIIE